VGAQLVRAVEQDLAGTRELDLPRSGVMTSMELSKPSSIVCCPLA
jgi:hypothetical protein